MTPTPLRLTVGQWTPKSDGSAGKGKPGTGKEKGTSKDKGKGKAAKGTGKEAQ